MKTEMKCPECDHVINFKDAQPHWHSNSDDPNVVRVVGEDVRLGITDEDRKTAQDKLGNSRTFGRRTKERPFGRREPKKT